MIRHVTVSFIVRLEVKLNQFITRIDLKKITFYPLDTWSNNIETKNVYA